MVESPEAGRLGCEARGHVTATCRVPCSREQRWQQRPPHRVLSITKRGQGHGAWEGEAQGPVSHSRTLERRAAHSESALGAGVPRV